MAPQTVQVALQNHEIYLGIWTNWSHGSVTGLTLTTTLRNGGLLIAFLALFVTFTGTCFWTITSFAFHQMQCRRGSQSAFYHQRQAILRNSSTSAAACWKLSRLLWAWRKRSPASATKGTWLSLTMGLISFGTFAAAGVFSSRVASSRGGEVLVVGEKCATFGGTPLSDEGFGRYRVWLARRIRSSANYASTCYASDSSADNCRTFVQHNIPFEVTKQIPCPFPGKDKICRSPNGGIRFDSGYINSHFDLGINSPPHERFFYRTVNECAPVYNEGFTRVNASTSPATLQFLYGTDTSGGFCSAHGCTFRHPVTADFMPSPHVNSDYTVVTVTRYAQPDDNNAVANNTWTPIPELFIPHADISAIFLAGNRVGFTAPVDDPWFSAGHVSFMNLTAVVGNIRGYLSDDPARALVCSQRYQYCNSSMPQNQSASCTPLSGMIEATKASLQLFPQEKDRKKFLWSASEILYLANGFNELVGTMQSGSLLARDSLAGHLQGILPDNQWELELEYWFKFALADLQRTILHQATGSVEADAHEFLAPPTSAEARGVCSNQKIRSDSYTSFNVLGLVLIFSIGGFIMLLSASLPYITRRLQRHRKPFGSLEWITNDTLQLQRLAHEALGAGVWEGACDDFPRTRDGDQLAVLDITDQKHPLLKLPEEALVLKQEESSDPDQESLLVLEAPRRATY